MHFPTSIFFYKDWLCLMWWQGYIQFKIFCSSRAWLFFASFDLFEMLSLEKLNWDSQQGRDLATSGRNKQQFQLGQSYSYIMRKVCYHQIWIQNNVGFMVLILSTCQRICRGPKSWIRVLGKHNLVWIHFIDSFQIMFSKNYHSWLGSSTI